MILDFSKIFGLLVFLAVADAEVINLLEETCPASGSLKTGGACEFVSQQCEAMAAAKVCQDNPSCATLCQSANVDLTKEVMPTCLTCEPTKVEGADASWDKVKAKSCLNKCFKAAIDRGTVEKKVTDTDCYRACIPETCNSEKFGSDAKYGACKFVLEQSEAMVAADVCVDEFQADSVITECNEAKVDTAKIPPCLKEKCSKEKEGFKLNDQCMNKCFENAQMPKPTTETTTVTTASPGASRTSRVVTDPDRICYEGCSEKITTTATTATTTEATTTTTTEATTTTTTAKDKKPSGVDPPVVAPVVPSNNQTLGNNSTAAPKPNAPNSNNSTGADAAIHVGQTLSLARMIFTALALVMAVKVIAA